MDDIKFSGGSQMVYKELADIDKSNLFQKFF